MDTEGNGCKLQLSRVPPGAVGLFLNAAVGIGGVPRAFQVDTGSAGILVPLRAVGGPLGIPIPNTPTEFRYVSSGNAYVGAWYELEVTLGLPDRGSEPARDTRVATATVAVFVVTAAKDAEGQLDYDWDGGMMGVGFQEETYSPGHPPQERLPPALARNPFLNARAEGAALPPRYLLTQDSIVLGPSAGETRDFSLVPLETEVDGFGWRAPTCLLTLSYQNVAESNPVSFLLDTGIPEMLLFLAESRRPPGLPLQPHPPHGLTIGVDLPGKNGAALSYQFTTGSPQPARIQPAEIRLLSADVATAANLNTGFTVLDAYAYLFDYGQGRMGFLRYP